MDQHYLPQCYLNEFKDASGNIYKIDCSLLTLGKTPYPRLATPASVCYQPDFYTLTDKIKKIYPSLKNLDPFYIEKQFHKYERDYPRLIKKIKDQHPFLPINEAITFIFSLVDIKIRNSYFRERASPLKKDLVRNEIFGKYKNDDSLKTQAISHFNLSESSFYEVIDKVQNEVLNDPDFTKNSHVAALAARYSNNAKSHDKVISNLLFYKWKFFKSTDQFITTDNPGWALDPDSNLHNTKFGKDFIFSFPITSCLCLVISDQGIDMDYYDNPSRKLLYAGNVPQEAIDSVNNLATRHFTKYIFCSNKAQAERVSKTIKLNKN